MMFRSHYKPHFSSWYSPLGVQSGVSTIQYIGPVGGHALCSRCRVAFDSGSEGLIEVTPASKIEAVLRITPLRPHELYC